MIKLTRLKGFFTKIMVLYVVVLLIITFSISAVNATTVTSGDLGNNVIHSGGTYILDLNVINPDNFLPANLVTKYGLWNSPNVPVDIYYNNNLVGNFVADEGYISPGPEFNTSDITGLLQNGLNQIKYVGSGTGDYVIGQVDINYTAVPLPGAFWLLGSGLFGLVGYRWSRKK